MVDRTPAHLKCALAGQLNLRLRQKRRAQFLPDEVLGDPRSVREALFGFGRDFG